ncbi:MAG: hypothetical protein GX587_12685 [Bacteroidales bacterium]|nr:hypothetical protein [Bacteroidales bacterium]
MNKTVDITVGAVFAIIFLAMLFIVNPWAIAVPTASVTEVGSVTPRFFPNLICIFAFIFSIITIVYSYKFAHYDSNEKFDVLDFKNKEHLHTFLTRLAAMTLLVIFPFIAGSLGIIVGGAILYILFALFCGEKNWLKAGLGSLICIALLYYFFVHIADVPMPLGFIEKFL